MALTGEHFIGMAEAGNYPDPLAVYDRLLPADEVLQPHDCVAECRPDEWFPPENGTEPSTERVTAALRLLGIQLTWPRNADHVGEVLAGAALIGAGERMLFDQMRTLAPEDESTQQLIAGAYGTHNLAGGLSTSRQVADTMVYRIVYLMDGINELHGSDDFSELAKTLLGAAGQTLGASLRLLNSVLELDADSMDNVTLALRDTDRCLQEVQPVVEYLADQFEMM